MGGITKRSPKVRLEFVAARRESIHGGLPAIEALAQQFGLWEKLRRIPSLDPRTRKSRGYSPELLVAQLIYSLCSGGASLADAERLNEEPLAKLLARVPGFADQTTLGQWLRAQTPQSVAALWALVQEFVGWVLDQADPRRHEYCGRREVFFDDTQLEVSGPSFEGAAINYEGQLALSWQTLWVGPLLAGGQLGRPGDVSKELPGLLDACAGLWTGRPADFLADSGSSAAKYLERIQRAGFTHWSVSYNKWTTVLEKSAEAQPESTWGPEQTATWRDGSAITEQHTFLRHRPESADEAFNFATVRFRAPGELFWRYRFVACEGPRRGGSAAVFGRHRLKGEKEGLLKEVLRGLDLHHPPCAELIANQAFYAIAALAYDLLAALKLLHLPDDCQSWQVKTLLRQVLLLPARIVEHARVLVAKVSVPEAWLSWWRSLMARLWPVGTPSG